MTRKTIRIFLLLSLLIFSLDAIFILINYYSSRRALNDQFSQISRDVEASFVQAQQATEQRMLQIATFVAADREIQQLFLAGKETVSREGGGAGGAESAVIREKLYQRVIDSRDALAARYDFRQLHFHLGPGSLSFLRVHAPKKFGDTMDTVRHTVVIVNHTQHPVSGFEIGRVYSGIRGVVPVFAFDPLSGRQLHVGALEAGTSCQYTLENAAQPRGVGMAVLLTVDYLAANIRPDYLQDFLQKKPPISGLAPESTTNPDIISILKNNLLPQGLKNLSWQVADFAGAPNLIIRFPFYDFAGLHDQSLPPVGSVVAWKNVSSAMAKFDNSLKINIIYGFFGLLITELLLYFGIHIGAIKLEALVEQGRLDFAHSLEQLEESEEKFLTMAEFSVDWGTWCGVDGEYLYVTPSCEEISGYPAKKFYEDSKFFVSILHPDDRGKFFQHQKQHYHNHAEPAEITFRVLHKDGDVRWIWHKCQAVHTSDGNWRGRRSTNRDITAIKQAEEKLQLLSSTDSLTGAYNRRMFMNLLAREMKRAVRYGEPFCLLMFDIDRFKEVNDIHGHDVGDRILIEVVRLSTKIIRQSDFLARWGSEEFMALLPHTTREMAFGLGERLRQCIGEHEFADIGSLTVSVGVAYQQQNDTIDTLLKRVDTAMYSGKNSGGNRVVAG